MGVHRRPMEILSFRSSCIKGLGEKRWLNPREHTTFHSSCIMSNSDTKPLLANSTVYGMQGHQSNTLGDYPDDEGHIINVQNAVRILAVLSHPLNILAVANDASQNREVAVNATGPGWVIGTAVAFMRLMEKITGYPVRVNFPHRGTA